MTVKELIELLKTYPADAEVLIADSYWGDSNVLYEEDIEYNEGEEFEEDENGNEINHRPYKAIILGKY